MKNKLKKNTHLLTYATTGRGFPDYAYYQKRLEKSAQNFGISHFHTWTRSRLREEINYHQFSPYPQLSKLPRYSKRKNKVKIQRDEVNRARTFLIWKVLKESSEGDIIIYLDSDMIFINDPLPLIEKCQKSGYFLVEVRHPDRLIKQWTKRDTFYFMNLDDEDYHNSYMSISGIQLYKKTGGTLSFIKKYLNYCLNPFVMNDIPNICGKPNLSGFNAHRREQSVLSLLREYYDINGYRNPVHESDKEIYPDSDYSRILVQDTSPGVTRDRLTEKEREALNKADKLNDDKR